MIALHPAYELGRQLTHLAAITFLSLVALLQGFAGLYRLDDYRANLEEVLASNNWTAAFAPPPWVNLILIGLLALLALALAWRLSKIASAQLLALFSALLACGYGVIVTAESSPLVDGYVNAVPILRDWGFNREVLRSLLYLVTVLERLLWFPAWALAGAVSIHFVRRVLGLAAASPRDGIAAAAMVQLSFAVVAAMVVHESSVALAAIGLGLMGPMAWRRQRRNGASAPAWPLAASSLLMLCIAVSPEDAVYVAPVAAVLMVPVAWRVSNTWPNLLFVFPALLAVAAAHSHEVVTLAMLAMLLWLAVCMVVVVTTILTNIRTLATEGRRQALWFLSGWIVATTAVAVWVLLTAFGRLAGCSLASESIGCLIHRYKEWFFMAPLPILLLSFVTALLYRGAIDAAQFFRRTAVYGSLFLLSLFVLGSAEALLGDLVRDGLPADTPPMLAAGLMAVVFYPAKRACDRVVDRWLARLRGWADGPE